MRPLLVLCTREVQQSIKASCHKLLCDQIANLGLGAFYDIGQAEIVGVNGTKFMFAGLSDQTAESLKSYEGVDIVWVEEGQVTSERSWEILIPTIRRDGSEIWITWNPRLDTDATWVRFVEKPHPETIDCEMNWRDNPWFNSIMEAERLHAKATMTNAQYENVWEGKCLPAISGAIYADEVAAMYTEGRIGAFPYDQRLLVYPVFDLGWNDSMVVGLCQRVASSMRVIDYIEDSKKTLAWYSAQLRAKPYNYGTLFLPHDGDHGDYKTGASAKDLMEGLSWTVHVLPRVDIEHGIRAARMMFSGAYIDREKCARLVECLKRYRRGVPNSTGEPGSPVHDEFSHGADMWRYAAMAAPEMTNSQGMSLPALKYGKSGIV
jgi:phage terminase large subunit